MELLSDLSWEAAAAVASALLGLLALLGGYLNWRERSLRRDEVHEWADRAIETLQTLVLLCTLEPPVLPPDEARSRRTEAVFRTSILVEQGRMFFRNRPAGSLGRHKPPAYRGRRPAVLDHLVAAHKVALALPEAGPEARAKLSLVAEDALKAFVSALQHEVGRSRTASVAAGRLGESVDLDRLVERLDPNRVSARIQGQ